MKTFHLSALVFVAALFAVQQAAAQDIVDFDRFRVLLNNGQRIEARDGILTSDSLTATKSGGERLSIPREQIRAMDRYKGSRAGTGFMIGAAMGLSAALLGYAEVKSDPYMEVNEDAVAPVFIGFTLGGGLIGLAVGSASKKWERVPLEPSAISITADGPRVTFTLRF
ncbi:MAG: hypothetical protein KKG33_02220 [candidate division Zixibacteria bacterium]|nr:hypothetical protein [candidate division Zixibacteria bacterium]MBU2624357.1 hypothetical protein [candidate division Zixibacteria bacterium]